MTPSEKIKICLDMKNLKRKDLAEASGMSPSSVSDFLNGKTTKLDITKAQSIANTLGCTLDYLVGDDTMHLELGAALKAEREEHGETTDVVTLNTKIPEALILKYEHDDEPVSYFLFGKLCQHYDLSIVEFLQKYDLYDEYIPPQFNGDAEEYETFRRAEREDAMREQSSYPELKDIVDNGWYQVDGVPARRTFKGRLDNIVKFMYQYKYTVGFPNVEDAKDAEAGLDEYIEMCKLLAKQPEDQARLNAVLSKMQSSNMSIDEKLDLIIPLHMSLLPSIE